MERGVSLDEGGRAVGAFHPSQAFLETQEILLAETWRREPGRLGLEKPPHLMDLEQRVGPREVADEADPGEQQVGLESGDVGAVADAGSSTPTRASARRLPQRAARDAEPLGELALGRKARPAVNSPELISSLIFAIAWSVARPVKVLM